MDNLLSTATSFLGSKSHSSSAPAHDAGHGGKPSADSQESSYGDVFGSAQVLMGAAKTKMSPGQHGDGGGVDMGELAGAAANLVGAASRYGHLENSSYGGYAQKAESYLHDYQAKHGKPSQDPHLHQSLKPSQDYSEEEENPTPHQGRKPSHQEDYPNPDQGPRRADSYDDE